MQSSPSPNIPTLPSPSNNIAVSHPTSSSSSSSGTDLDIVVFGATGFTGKLAAEYLVSTYGPTSTTPLRIGLAGRSLKKLVRLRDQLEVTLTGSKFAKGTAAASSFSSNSKTPLVVSQIPPDCFPPSSVSPPPPTTSSSPPGSPPSSSLTQNSKWQHLPSPNRPLLLSSVALIEADISDPSSLVRMTARCRALANFAGPYGKYGSPVVAACIETNTNYCDISGEFRWVRAMQVRLGEQAAQKGIKLVHFAGMECLPFDLGVYLVQKHAMARYGVSCEDVRIRISSIRGGLSGGSLSSVMRIVGQSGKGDLEDGYYFCRGVDGRLCRGVMGVPDDEEKEEVDGKDGHELEMGGKSTTPSFGYESDVGFTHAYFAEFLERKVVNWTHMILYHCADQPCSMPKAGSFRYSESFAFRLGWLRSFLLGYVYMIMFGPGKWLWLFFARLSVVQWIMENWIAPRIAGFGMLPATAGHLEFSVLGTTAPDMKGDTHNLKCNVKIRGDPGYVETGGMCVESAVCLALDIEYCPPTAGVLTPAAALGDAAIDRLNKRGRVTFSMV